MLQPSKIAPGYERHEEIFLARYGRLRGWALQLTEHNRERAEDLVHDAFIQFTFTRPDLKEIHNLDGYLYSMLRNLHLSQVRRTTRLRSRSLSMVDYDSAEIGLQRATDPRDQMRLQDELHQICQYACLRKETSKAGSVLILRFMHGYYPREIAQVMRSSRQAVEERLRVSRTEARHYLENPGALRFMHESSARTATFPVARGFARTTDELLLELRRTIFQSCRGDCLTGERLESLYHGDDGSGPDGATLGHIVSCPRCLDAVNHLLGLPPLSERYPTDTLGTDSRRKGGGDDDGGGGATGAGSEKEFERRSRRRAAEVFEHRPQELCISVNGYMMAAQKIGAELSEQTLSVNIGERIDFVEVISEQEIRLLFLCVDEPPPGGPYKRSARVELSDERTLEATLSFSSPWPTVQVVYHDPLLSAESEAESRRGVEEAAPASLSAPVVAASRRGWRWLSGTGFWLRPGTVTAGLALFIIAALLLVRMQLPTVSAAELLHRAAVAEETAFRDPGLVLRRTIDLEERRGDGGALVSRRRIEVWQSAARGIKLRRIYDERERLVAGEWTKADGTSTVYRRGAAPQDRAAPENETNALLEAGDIWRLDPSAKNFSTLTGRAEAVGVEERLGTYVLSYQNDERRAGSPLLLQATLTLSKGDLRAIQQTLLVERDGEAREYRFTETGRERRPTEQVAPIIFQPEPELLGSSGSGEGEEARLKSSSDSVDSSLHVLPPPTAVASAELEVEVTYLLNQIRADLGEQVTMARTTGGILRVEALVETERRKEEILRALGPVLKNRAVVVDVSTVAEGLKRQQASKKPGDLTVREVEVAANRIPADAELRRHFSARLAGSEAIDEEISQFANRVINRSRQALLRASALKRLVERFSPEETRTLTPEARRKWLAMIREHAQGYQREVVRLRQELRPIFSGAESHSGGAAGESVSEANLTGAAGRLHQLSYAHDEAVRSAFTISADGRTSAAIKAPQFWRSLGTAEKLAAAIQNVYQK